MTEFAILHIPGNGRKEHYLVETMIALYNVAQLCGKAISKEYDGIIEVQSEEGITRQWMNGEEYRG